MQSALGKDCINGRKWCFVFSETFSQSSPQHHQGLCFSHLQVQWDVRRDAPNASIWLRHSVQSGLAVSLAQPDGNVSSFLSLWFLSKRSVFEVSSIELLG
jgi:hypothetical protein